jgi:hypothetical protein
MAQKFFAYNPIAKTIAVYPDAQTRSNAGNSGIPFNTESELAASPLTLEQLVDLHNVLAGEGRGVKGFGDRAAAAKLTFDLATKAKIPVPASDAAPKTEGAAPKASKGKKKAEGSEGEGASAGRSGDYAGHKLKSAVDANPRREGSHGAASFQIVLDNPGISYEDFIAKGGRPQNLRKDITLGRIVAVKPA